jgi:AcrR family transcriptional regulator
MRASKAKTEIRHGQIAQAALKLLAVRGWRRVSLVAIAKEVGIVASDVYRHFTSKDPVLDGILDLAEQSLRTNFDAARQATTDPVACLREVHKSEDQEALEAAAGKAAVLE